MSLVSRPAAGLSTSAGLLLLLLASTPALPATAQEDAGSFGAAVGGAALGAFSGAGFGLVGALVPCSYRMNGVNCARVLGVAGGLVGAASGAVIGARDSDLLMHHLGNAAMGAAIGGAVGYVLRGVVRHYGWIDAGAGVLLGAAFGAAPEGAGIGFAVGTAVGGALFLTVPQMGAGEAVGFSLLGVAVGGLTQWIGSAAEAGPDKGPAFETPLFRITF